jgi:phosphoglycerate dehydrogenase-like enzyme
VVFVTCNELSLSLCPKVLSVTSASTRLELEAVLADSDVVSLHVPLTPATVGMIGETGDATCALFVAAQRADVLMRFVEVARRHLSL